MSFSEVLYDYSYKNLMLYCAVLPTYDSKTKDEKSGDGKKIIDADDPANDDLIDRLLG